MDNESLQSELTDDFSNNKPFDFIKRCDPAHVFQILMYELPQTIAVILSFLEPKKAALLLQNFTKEVQIDVARRISTMNIVEAETIREIEKILEKKLLIMKNKDAFTYSGGVAAMIEILNYVDRGTEKEIIEGFEEADPELAEEIKNRLFTFEDIVMLGDCAIQKVMREVDSQELAKALKGVDAKVQNKIFKNLSRRAGAMLKEDMDYIGPIRLKEVEEAQAKIIAVIRHFEDTGEIVAVRADDELIVDEKIPEKQTTTDNQGLPYKTMDYLLAYSKKDVFERIDNETLAVSLFAADKYQKEMIFKNLSFNKKLKVKRLIKNLKEIWQDDVREAQKHVTEILRENLDEDDIKTEEVMLKD